MLNEVIEVLGVLFASGGKKNIVSFCHCRSALLRMRDWVSIFLRKGGLAMMKRGSIRGNSLKQLNSGYLTLTCCTIIKTLS